VPILRVLSYNVRSLRDDPVAVARVIGESGAHLVFLQEAPAFWRWRARCSQLARRCAMVAVAGGGGGAFGNFLLCSPAVLAHSARTFRLAHAPMRPDKGAAVAELSYGGVRFVAAGTHLTTGDATHDDEHEAQLRSLLAELPGPDGLPLIVAGDLNEEHTGPAWRALAARLTDAGAGSTTPTFSCRTPRRRIDGIFADPRLPVRQYRVLDSPDVRRASDHFPIYAELEL
jgi:endonuclease/exonuclease/phosphatase family metal-dependent hydrolase